MALDIKFKEYIIKGYSSESGLEGSNIKELGKLVEELRK